jgi:hypothetical protein
MDDLPTTPATGVANDTDAAQRLMTLFDREEQAGAPEQTVETTDAAPVQPQAAPEEQAPSDELTVEDLPDEPEGAAPSQGDEFEIVHNGQQHKLNREETIRLAQQGFDYTQKTQALADNARQMSERMQRLAEIEQVLPAVSSELATVKAFEAQLGQFQNVDWVKLATDDPLEYPRVRAQYDQLLNGYQAAYRQYQDKGAAVNQQMGRLKAEQLQQEAALLPQIMPAWKDPAKLEGARTEMFQYLQSLGLDVKQVASQYLDTAFAFKTLYESIQYQKLQKAKTDKVKQLRTAPPVVRPGASQPATSSGVERERQAKDRLRKSGDLADAAAVLLNRMK